MWAARKNRRNFTNFLCSSVTKNRYFDLVVGWWLLRWILPVNDELHSHLLALKTSELSSLLFNRSKINLWMPMDWFCNLEVKLFSRLTLGIDWTLKLAVLLTPFWVVVFPPPFWLLLLLLLLWGRVKLEARWWEWWPRCLSWRLLSKRNSLLFLGRLKGRSSDWRRYLDLGGIVWYLGFSQRNLLAGLSDEWYLKFDNGEF